MKKWCWLPFLAAVSFAQSDIGQARVFLLNPEVNGQDVAIPFSFQNFFPGSSVDDGDTLVVELSRDDAFTEIVQIDFLTEGPITYRGLQNGDYWVRARIRRPNPEDPNEPLFSADSNTVSFRVLPASVPQPVIQLRELEPVIGDAFTVFWTPLALEALDNWQLQVSRNPSFSGDCDVTQNFFPGPNDFEFEISLTELSGMGVLYVRIRANLGLDQSAWSNVLDVRYDRSPTYVYSIPHVPNGEVWEAYLQLYVSEDFEGSGPLDIYASYIRPSSFGGSSVTRSPIEGVARGQVQLVRISDEFRGTPALIHSSVPLNLGVQYIHAAGGQIGAWQAQPFIYQRRVGVSGLAEIRTGDPSRKIISAIVVANQSSLDAEMILRFIITDRNSGLQSEEVTALDVPRRSNHAALLSDFLGALPLLDQSGIAIDWSISVFVASNRDGVDLLGAIFDLNNGVMTQNWMTAAPAE